MWQQVIIRRGVQESPDTVAIGGTTIRAREASNVLHENVFDGDLLRVARPFGDLVLDDSTAPLLLISTGIGYTPMVGTLHHLSATKATPPISARHADRSPARQAHRRELQERVDQPPSATLHHWYENLGEPSASETTTLSLINLDAVELPRDAHVYLCGPMPFMESVRSTSSTAKYPPTRDDWVPVGAASACESPMPEDGCRRTSRLWDDLPREPQVTLHDLPGHTRNATSRTSRAEQRAQLSHSRPQHRRGMFPADRLGDHRRRHVRELRQQRPDP